LQDQLKTERTKNASTADGGGRARNPRLKLPWNEKSQGIRKKKKEKKILGFHQSETLENKQTYVAKTTKAGSITGLTKKKVMK